MLKLNFLIHILFEDGDEDIEFFGLDISPGTDNGINNVPELISLCYTTNDEDFFGFVNAQKLPCRGPNFDRKS